MALSVGGNVEQAPDDLPAVAGYDAAGYLVAGEPGLADPSAIGLGDIRREPLAKDARGADPAERLAALVDRARRQLTGLTRRLVTHAVIVVPDDVDPAVGAVLFRAVEAGGLEPMRMIAPREARAVAAERLPADRVSALLGAALVAEDMR